MATTHYDQFYLIDPYSPPAVGTVLNPSYLSYVDQNDDGVLSVPTGDSINSQDIQSVYRGDTVTVSINGVNVTIRGVTFYTAGGGRYFSPIDGTNLQNATFVSSTYVSGSTSVTVSEMGPPCFVTGTLIETPEGSRRVEDLQVGDRVKTLDHGPQPIRWIGHSSVDGRGKNAPVVFLPGAIGNERVLRVSPQHRILMQGWQAELYHGVAEVLVPAKFLVDGTRVLREPGRKVDYYHILFEQHEIVWSEGVLSESFFPGDHMLLQNRAVQAELFEIFPDLAQPESRHGHKTARVTVKSREALLLKHAA